MGLGKLARGLLHALLELLLKQRKVLLLQLVSALASQIVRFHGLHHRPNYDAGFYRKLRCSQAKRLACNFFRYTVHLVKHLTGANFCHPVLDAAFTFTHSHGKRLLSNRLIREYPNPNFSAALNMAGHSTTGCFDLARSQTATSNRLQTDGAERHLAAALCQTAVAALHYFPELSTFRLQHRQLPFSHGRAFCSGPCLPSLPAELGPYHPRLHRGRSIP